jgi:hypothetical protein
MKTTNQKKILDLQQKNIIRGQGFYASMLGGAIAGVILPCPVFVL